MGILTALRRTVAETIAAVAGPAPLELRRVSGDSSADTVYQAHRNGLCVTVFQDYAGAPWSWTVEDAADGRLVAFRGAVASCGLATLAVSEWLASPEGQACQGGKRTGFDVPPSAA